MLAISKSKFFNRYLPMFLSVVLIVAAAFAYLIFKPGTQVAKAAPAFLQASSNAAYSGASVTEAFSSNVTAGNLITVGTTGSGGVLSSVTATCITGNLSTVTIDAAVNTSQYVYMAYGIVTSSGSCSVTATYSASGAQGLIIQEVSGIVPVSPFDTSSVNFSAYGSTSTPSSGTATTTRNGDYIFGYENNGNGNDLSSAGTGFTFRSNEVGDGSIDTEDAVQSSAGSIAATFNMASSAGNFDVGMMAFKAANNPNILVRGGGGGGGAVKVRGGGGPVILQSCTSGHYSATASCTLPNNLSGGTKLVAVGYSSQTGDTLSISGCSVTWTNIYSDTSSPNYTWDVWTAPATAGTSCSPSQTINSSDYNFLNVMEVQGIGALDTTPADYHATCNMTGCVSPSITTSTNGDFVLFTGFIPSLQYTYSAFTNGFNIFQQNVFTTESGGLGSNADAYLVQPTAGSISPTYSISGYTGSADSILMAFKPVVSGGGGVVFRGGGTPFQTPVFFQSTSSPSSNGTGVTSQALTFASNNKAGDLIVVTVSSLANDGATYTTPTDSQGNTYNSAVGPVFTTAGNSIINQMWYAMNIKAGANTVTTHLTGGLPGNRYATMNIHEYSNVLSSGALDVTASATGTAASSGVTISSGSATTAINNELIFGLGNVESAAFTAGSGFTLRENSGGDTEDKIQATAGSAAATGVDGNSGDHWAMLMATFK